MSAAVATTKWHRPYSGLFIYEEDTTPSVNSESQTVGPPPNEVDKRIISHFEDVNESRWFSAWKTNEKPGYLEWIPGSFFEHPKNGVNCQIIALIYDEWFEVDPTVLNNALRAYSKILKMPVSFRYMTKYQTIERYCDRHGPPTKFGKGSVRVLKQDATAYERAMRTYLNLSHIQYRTKLLSSEQILPGMFASILPDDSLLVEMCWSEKPNQMARFNLFSAAGLSRFFRQPVVPVVLGVSQTIQKYQMVYPQMFQTFANQIGQDVYLCSGYLSATSTDPSVSLNNNVTQGASDLDQTALDHQSSSMQREDLDRLPTESLNFETEFLQPEGDSFDFWNQTEFSGVFPFSPTSMDQF